MTSSGWGVRTGLLWVLFACVGCGSELYEQRLAETARWFEFQERQDQLLAKPWSGPGIKFRAPKALTPYPAPPPEEIQDQEGNWIPNPDYQGDFRQPEYMNATLPGLVGAWHGEVETRTNGGTEQLPAYMYLCSNWEIWLETDPVDRATAFHQSVADAVTGPLGIFLQEDDWDNEKYPRVNGYLVPKSYTLTSKTTDVDFSDEPYRLSIYLHQINDIRVALVLVAPANIDSRVRFEEAMDLALQTLDVSGEKPQRDGFAPSSDASGVNF